MECLAIILIPAALTHTFGLMVKDVRQGWCLFMVMLVILAVFLGIGVYSELKGNASLEGLGVDQQAGVLQSGGNMEGKEVRIGAVGSALWATLTTATSNGSVNSMHDSFTPLGGMAPLSMILFGEVIFGGVGSGLYGMLAFVIVAVFIAGLMVGRTPEYLGKKLAAFEMKMASLMILLPLVLVLLGTGIGVSLEAMKSSILNPGAHGFSEVLYAFASASNNNGSAFAGLNAGIPLYNAILGLCMLVGRFWLIIPALAIAGSLAQKKIVPPSAGTLPTHTPLFAAWLIGVVALVGLLTFLPALALGPIIESLKQIVGAGY